MTPSRPAPSPPPRIDLRQPYQLRDWSKRFGVHPDELKAAIAAVGDRVDAVEAWLRESGLAQG